MPILDLFKKKEKEKEAKKPVLEVKDKDKKPKPEPEKKETVSEKPAPKPRGKKFSQAYRVLKSPQITEKASVLGEKNQYTFKIWPRVNKTQVKKAVEDLYGVNVLSVRITKVLPKKRKLGRISGWRKGYKKAVVKIKEGQKIEIMPR